MTLRAAAGAAASTAAASHSLMPQTIRLPMSPPLRAILARI
jgi:hypothetical protein